MLPMALCDCMDCMVHVCSCSPWLSVTAWSVWSHMFMVPMALCVCMVCMVSLCVHPPDGSLCLHGLYGVIVCSSYPWFSVIAWSVWSLFVFMVPMALCVCMVCIVHVCSWSPWLSVWSMCVHGPHGSL